MSFINLLLPHGWYVLLGALFLLGTNCVFFILPRLVNYAVEAVDGGALPNWFLSFESMVPVSGLTVLCLSVVVVAILGAIMRTFSRRMFFNVGRDVEREVRDRLFQRLTTLSPEFYQRRNVGDLMNLMTTDITNIRLYAGFAILNLLNIAIMFGGTVPLLLSIDWVVATAALMPFPLVMWAAQASAGTMFARVRDYQGQLSKLTGHVQENLGGAQLVRVFHQQEAEEKRFAHVNRATMESSLRLAKIRLVMFPSIRFIAGLGVAATLYVGGRAVVLDQMSVGDFVEINTRLLQLAWPAMSIGFVISVYNRGRASLARVNDLESERPKLEDGAIQIDKLDTVRAQDLSVFAGEKALLHKVNFTLERGRVLGVVGASGSGKSSLVRALARESTIARQQLFLNDHDVCDVALNACRSRIAVVHAEPFLFSDTIRNNIAFAKPHTSDADIWRAVEHVGLAPDMAGFVHGLDTIVGERGVTLSGGQRQRIAIARALLAGADLLVLDDALSAVDADTERHIVEFLRSGNVAPMVLIVSHRLSAVQHADEIIVLDRGEVVERGTHEQLLGTGAKYRALWGIEQIQESLRVA